MKLVFIENNLPVTDSLTVAEVFGKRHADVMRDIEVQIAKLKEAEMQEWGVRNFAHTQYQNEQNGQWYFKYNMTEDAFAIVAMSYITPEAMKMKVRFLDEFKAMREQLSKPQFTLPQTMAEALRLAADLSEQNERMAKEKQLLENTIDEQRPLVAFAETCMDSERNLLVREVAKLASKNGIMIGEKRLYQKLREWGMIFQHRTEPTQRAMELGLFEIKKGVTQTPKGARDFETAKVTPKGQVYIIDRLKREALREGA